MQINIYKSLQKDLIMQTSKRGRDAIKLFEGLRTTAYRCPAGVWTIGYGHTGKDITEGLTISTQRAEVLLMKDLIPIEKGIQELVKVPLTQGQFDALVSFTYNLGLGSLRSSTLLKLLNLRKYTEAANQFERWVYAGNKKLEGLVRRRRKEKEIFLS